MDHVRIRYSHNLTQHPDALRRLHQHAPELARYLREQIQGRTEIDTGALIGSIRVRAVPGNGPQLVTAYAQQADQLAQWNRVYDKYQEGPPLGLWTYTNPPRQMFYRVSTDDAEGIQSWANDVMVAYTGELQESDVVSVNF